MNERSDKNLAALYGLLQDIAGNFLTAYCRKRNIRLGNFQELIHDAAMNVVIQYLTDPAFKIKRISGYIYYPLKKELYRNRKHEEGISSLDAVGGWTGK